MAAEDFGVFNDYACMIPCSSIEWGTDLLPSHNYTHDVYVKNFAADKITRFSVAGEDFVPANASSYLNVALDAASIIGKLPLMSQDVIKLTLILIVNANATEGPFSFNIILTARYNTPSGGGGGGGDSTYEIPSSPTSTPPANNQNMQNFILFLVIAVCIYVLVGGKKR